MHMVYNVFQTQSNMGFGDFLRGTYSLWELSQTLNIKSEPYLHNHLIKEFIQPMNNILNPTTIPIFWKLEDRPHLTKYIQNSQHSPIFLTTNVVPLTFKLCEEAKIHLKHHLQMTPSFADYYNNQAPEGEYTVVHVRGGDIRSDRVDNKGLQKIKNQITKDGLQKMDNVYICCDNLELREQLIQEFNFKSLGTNNVCHTGVNDALDEQINYQSLQSTIFEFYVMSKASSIYQYSNYWWGSGFSEWCAKIFDIPLFVYTIQNPPNHLLNIQKRILGDSHINYLDSPENDLLNLCMSLSIDRPNTYTYTKLGINKTLDNEQCLNLFKNRTPDTISRWNRFWKAYNIYPDYQLDKHNLFECTCIYNVANKPMLNILTTERVYIYSPLVDICQQLLQTYNNGFIIDDIPEDQKFVYVAYLISKCKYIFADTEDNIIRLAIIIRGHDDNYILYN